MATLVGVISDTHGLLRPEAVEALWGVDYIIHAGDIGSAKIIEELSAVAPVSAVRGNCDRGLWADGYPVWLSMTIEDAYILALHNRNDLKKQPPDRKYHVVVTGHSHRAAITVEDGVLFLNPGSAGPKRFKLPITVAKLTVEGDRCSAEIVLLKC